jgi:hypothetical protein
MLTPSRLNVAVPAVRGSRYVIVALVAKFGFGRVTIEAGIGKTHGIFLAIAGSIGSDALADHGFSPINQQIHMVGSHPINVFYALLFISRKIELRNITNCPTGGTNPDGETY